MCRNSLKERKERIKKQKAVSWRCGVRGRCQRCGSAAENDEKTSIFSRALRITVAAARATMVLVPSKVTERGKRLETKAQTGRPTAAIVRLLPPGRAALKKKKARALFGKGEKGDKRWAASVDKVTEGFIVSSRQSSTAKEHVSYMIEWNELLIEQVRLACRFE